jgi:hypothetical protein
MQKRILLVLLALCVALPLGADQDSPALFFGGHRLFIGMAQTEAMTLLSQCCKLSPPPSADAERLAAEKNQRLSRFIFSNEDSPQRILGTISFSGGKVVRLSHPLDEQLNPAGSDAIALARALDRSLTQSSSDSPVVVFVSTRHERAMNGESEYLSFAFPSGRTVELQIVTLDTLSPVIGGRDSYSLDEILTAPTR